MAEGSADKGVRFRDKVAIVTGGCLGIGKGVVDVFTDHGGKVAIFDINDSVGERLTGKAGKGEILFIHCDTTSEEDIQAAIEKTVAKFGKLDCLVNNAGWHPPAQTIDHFTTDDFRKLLELNLVGYFMCCKYALPHLRLTEGSIINISSASQWGQIDAVTYTATKGGVSAMTRGLALDEAKHGVRVNSVSPGSTATPLMHAWLASVADEEKEQAKKTNLFGRFADPQEMGYVCLFLATDATYCTAIDIHASAGIEMGLWKHTNQFRSSSDTIRAHQETIDALQNKANESEETIAVLPNKAHESEDTIRAHQETIDALQNKAQESEETVTALPQQLREQTRAGSTYIRWGRTSCPGHGSELVYAGVAGGSRYNHTGAAAEYLCLPLEPEYRNYKEDAPQTAGGHVYGAEYQLNGREDRMKFFPNIDSSPDLLNQNVPCAVCHVSRGTMIMVPAKRTCMEGWTREYEGLLVSDHHTHVSATEYICLDDQPEVITGGGGNENGKLLYFVEGRCGSLPCPHYVNGRELSCVVCTK